MPDAPSPEPPSAGTPNRPRERNLMRLLLIDPTSVGMQQLGKTLLHTALVGLAAGLVGAFFFAALEYTQQLLLEGLAGYTPLRALGETFASEQHRKTFRPWVLLLLPAVGALLAGLLMRMAPETEGGGGDATIHAYHEQGGVIRPRVIWVKLVASVLTLSSGGSGGREGPTMQIGGALGSLVGRLLKVTPQERRILMVAGVAAGISAVFRTPLGAALLAVEILYRDEVESEALVPAVLASVISYSVVLSLFGESLLFARASRYAFLPSQLPLYGILALVICGVAVLFLSSMHTVRRLSRKLPIAPWLRPAAGGLALGAFAVPIVVVVGDRLGDPGQGLGLLGGTYGAAQMSITSAPWLTGGWGDVELLLLVCVGKLIATALTIGTGGSAGDFAPSLVLGALLGGAFGRAARLLLGDPTIDPGAFALVGMGTFYGGIAHVPISSIILVCEMAGSYDLLVPLMLCEGIAFLVLRRRQLYDAQPANHREVGTASVATVDPLMTVHVGSALRRPEVYGSFALNTPTHEILERAQHHRWQEVFPVMDAKQKVAGLINTNTLRLLNSSAELRGWTIAADVMQPVVTVREDDTLRLAARMMIAHGLRQIPVVDAEGKVAGFLDEAAVFRAYLEATRQPDRHETPMPMHFFDSEIPPPK